MKKTLLRSSLLELPLNRIYFYLWQMDPGKSSLAHSIFFYFRSMVTEFVYYARHSVISSDLTEAVSLSTASVDIILSKSLIDAGFLQILPFRKCWIRS